MSPSEGYAYDLPRELIANAPAHPRDSARLLVYSTQTDEVVFDTFANISRYIPYGSVLVVNDTKVVPARLQLEKETGGMVNILFLMNEWDGGKTIKGLPDRRISAGDALTLVRRPVVKVISNDREEFVFELSVEADVFRQLIDAYGRTPLPPYIRSDMSEEQIRSEYQTTFASHPASVAAPTASLHFTDSVFRSLDDKGISRVPVTLHVGRGTFSPVNAAAEKEGKLHSEPVLISAESAQAMMAAKREGRKVVASGTTAIRAVESASTRILEGQAFDGDTNIFIRPPYEFKIADALITNFHLPNTSLLALLDAFLRSKDSKKTWREIYDMAIKEKFRFYSFGDAMLIL